MWQNVLEFLKDALIWIGLIIYMLILLVMSSVLEDKDEKLWKKTAFFLVTSQVFPVLMVISGVSAICNGNVGGGIAILILGAVVSVGFVAGAVYGHKRGWKK